MGKCENYVFDVNSKSRRLKYSKQINNNEIYFGNNQTNRLNYSWSQHSYIASLAH